jgi:hypothetical protein
MDYNINIPDIYNNHESLNDKNDKKNIKCMQIEIKAHDTITEKSISMLFEKKYGSLVYDTCSIVYITTNNTKLYLYMYYGTRCVKIYDKMFYMLGNGKFIRNVSDIDAIINIYIIYHLGYIILEQVFYNDLYLNYNTYSNSNSNAFDKSFFQIDTHTIKIVENIFIKTKKDIKNKFMCIDSCEIEFYYKINNIEKNNYILNLYKITNKINKKELNILYSNKTLENLIYYYKNLVLGIIKLFNYDYYDYTEWVLINNISMTELLFNNYYIYYEIIRIPKNI